MPYTILVRPLQNSSLSGATLLLLPAGARAAGGCYKPPDPLLLVSVPAAAAAAGVTPPNDCTKLPSATPCDAGPGSSGDPTIGDQLSPDCDSTSAFGQLCKCKGSGCQELSWVASCCCNIGRGCDAHCSAVRAGQSSKRRLRRSCPTLHTFRRRAFSVSAQATVHIGTTLIATHCTASCWTGCCSVLTGDLHVVTVDSYGDDGLMPAGK